MHLRQEQLNQFGLWVHAKSVTNVLPTTADSWTLYDFEDYAASSSHWMVTA